MVAIMTWVITHQKIDSRDDDDNDSYNNDLKGENRMWINSSHICTFMVTDIVLFNKSQLCTRFMQVMVDDQYKQFKAVLIFLWYIYYQYKCIQLYLKCL